MIPPPYSASDARGLDRTYDDVRIPDTWRLGDILDRREPMPVGYQAVPAMPARRVDSPCVVSREPGVAGAGLLRHLFDAIEVAGPDVYGPDDELAPSRFALTLACVRCGYVEHYAGTRDPGREANKTHRLNAEPLRAGHLEAQETRERDSWDHTGEPDSLTVYRRLSMRGAGSPAGPDVVEAAGIIARERGPRGRRYYVGRLGDLRAGRQDDDPRAEGPTALSVLRRLAKLDEDRQADRLADLAELRRRNAEEEAGRQRAAAARAAELAARVVPLRQEPTP